MPSTPSTPESGRLRPAADARLLETAQSRMAPMAWASLSCLVCQLSVNYASGSPVSDICPNSGNGQQEVKSMADASKSLRSADEIASLCDDFVKHVGAYLEWQKITNLTAQDSSARFTRRTSL